MKKVFSIFLTVIFLASALGVTVNSHFCGMKLRSVSLVTNDCCCKKDSKMPKGCCKNEVKYVKITDEFTPSSEFHVEKPEISPVVLDYSFSSEIFSSPVTFISNSHAPPPKVERFVEFHSFLI